MSAYATVKSDSQVSRMIRPCCLHQRDVSEVRGHLIYEVQESEVLM
jgi:hypothetical protein